jgi:hypothetical protein
MNDRSKHLGWDFGDVEHHKPDPKDQIKLEFQRRQLDYLDAIETLVRECGMAPKEAESLVSDWQENPVA